MSDLLESAAKIICLALKSYCPSQSKGTQRYYLMRESIPGT